MAMTSSPLSAAPSCVRAQQEPPEWILPSQFKNKLQSAHFEPGSVPFEHPDGQTNRTSALHFSGEEDALPFTVRGGDCLQLQEIQQHLDLQGHEEKDTLNNELPGVEETEDGVSLTCAMTSKDQLSPMLMGCVGLVGILLSFSAGLSKVGPKTVARLWRDILLTLSFSATLRG